jgi:hypothetical protein
MGLRVIFIVTPRAILKKNASSRLMVKGARPPTYTFSTCEIEHRTIITRLSDLDYGSALTTSSMSWSVL